MKNQTVSRKPHNERREEIIEAAISLVGQGGIQMLTTKNLAKKVSLSEPALYRHFSDKIDILRQLLEYLSERILSRISKIADAPDPPGQKLDNLIRRQFHAFSMRPEIITVLLSEGLYQNNRELSDLIYSIMRKSADVYTKVILEGQKGGVFRDDLPAERLAFMVMGNMRFCAIQWHLAGNSYDIVARGEEVLETIRTLIK